MWEYYEAKSVLVTGGSGFLGTTIVHRLVMSTSLSRIYLVCRGTEKLLSKWREWLPPNIVNKVYDTKRLIVLDGDILLPNLGFLQSELDMIRDEDHIIIHAASSINLGSALKRVSDPIIGASEIIANLAFTCKRLDRFIYVSSAFSNAHLYPRSPDADMQINEEICEPGRQSLVLDELNEVRKSGTSQAYEAENFPWAYAYAKHFTERLLQHYFSVHAAEKKLLIIRPCVIRPAQHFPFPGYNMPMSSPITMAVTAFALALTREVRIATKMDDPDDVVADRLLCHLAMGTIVEFLMKLRRIPWRLRFRWVKADWRSTDQHSISRLYAILGASFNFSENKSTAMCQKLSKEEQQDL
ncbi:male sterility protein-domain-containing protein [Aspergillus minisclerotigenes]|uniref:Fatty acyl-CoA reductase n=1 Tax=Aspergillus minisclerotigenes TaxID=656917 RepID=A0A5N6IYZ5_9EURO|nr:male sterility protein-domain-containing protein [Aspergillus minisclerotigenes]